MLQALGKPITAELTSTKQEFEYAVILISFKSSDKYVNRLNEYGKEGWIFSTRIEIYESSPYEGITTHDFICYRKLP